MPVSDSKRICVFCGSSLPAELRYREAAERLGMLIGAAGLELVYGGGRVGLMGLLADAALAAGARVTGIIPARLQDREVGHGGISQMIVVSDMQERKRRMFELADAVVVLPGGLGTLDEAFEAITLHQLGIWVRPIVLVNSGGFWTPFFALIDHVIAEGFARAEAGRSYHVVERIEDVLSACFGPERT